MARKLNEPTAAHWPVHDETHTRRKIGSLCLSFGLIQTSPRIDSLRALKFYLKKISLQHHMKRPWAKGGSKLKN